MRLEDRQRFEADVELNHILPVGVDRLHISRQHRNDPARFRFFRVITNHYLVVRWMLTSMWNMDSCMQHGDSEDDYCASSKMGWDGGSCACRGSPYRRRPLQKLLVSKRQNRLLHFFVVPFINR